MNLSKPHLSAVALAILLSSGALILNGCQSTAVEQLAQQSHGAKAGDGYTYGTGPNKTKPYPQSEPVNINGVGGATPRFEAPSRGGNSDYKVLGQSYLVWTNCNSYQEVGTASWYGPGFHGNKTSNGELYDQKGYTAAHKNLSLPSYLKVTNLENGRAVIVRVNDRGPFHDSRIIDLSEGAAKAIDMTKKGTARVKLELINTRLNNTTTEGGSGSGQAVTQTVAAGVIGNIIESNTTSTTRNNLQKIGDYLSERQNNGEVSDSTKAAAIGAGLYFAGKIGSALSEMSAESNSSSSSTSLRSTPSSSVTRTVTTTTTTNDGTSTTKQVVDTTSFAPVNNNQANYEVSYATPTAPLADVSSGKAVPMSSGAYVQLFSSSTLEGATKFKNNIRNTTKYQVVIMPEENLFRVRLGPVPEADAYDALEQMRAAGYVDAFIKHL